MITTNFIKEDLDVILAKQSQPSMYFPVSFPMFNKYFTIDQGDYYLIGGNTGTGKSALVYKMFILDVYNYFKDVDSTIIPRIYLRSQERSTHKLTAKWSASQLFEDEKEQVAARAFLNKGGKKLTDKELELFQKESYGKLVEMGNYVYPLKGGALTPEQIKEELEGIASFHGTWKTVTTHVGSYREYTQKNPNEFIIYILDHVGNTKISNGRNRKQTVDEVSSTQVYYRDRCNITQVAISQFNRGLHDVKRKELSKEAAFLPQESDFKDSSNLSEDADWIIGLLNPARFQIPEIAGYNLAWMEALAGGEKRFRLLVCIKASLERDNYSVGSWFIGETGNFIELPPGPSLTKQDMRRIVQEWQL